MLDPSPDKIEVGYGLGVDRVLVINADDLGISVQRNRGIVDAIEKGSVTAASLLVNGPAAVVAVEEFKTRGWFGRLGLHLNLTEGVPVALPSRIQSLVDHGPADGTGGRPHFLGKAGMWAATRDGKIELDEVGIEARAQIERFIELVGSPPTHIDGHQHCHVCPGLPEVLAPIFREYRVERTRIPTEEGASPNLCQVCASVHALAQRARSVYASAGVHSTDSFVGLSFCGRPYSPTEFTAAVRKQFRPEVRTVEAMVHPGYPEAPGQGWDNFSEATDRNSERATLSDPKLAALLAEITTLDTHLALVPVQRAVVGD